MPTYAELQQEVWWSREFQPPTLAELCRRLREHYNVGAIAIGSKGDNNHLRGYHRSDAWIENSRYCTNRTYSVTETPGNRNPGNVDWLCAIDMTIPRTELVAACQRLDVAVRAGRLEKITEWYGNKDGDTRVDGYNNITNQVATSDASHLWHLHMSFDRGRAGENHSDLYAILTGADMPLTSDDLKNIKSTVWYSDLDTGERSISAGSALLGVYDRPPVEPTPVDVAALAAALVADPAFTAALEAAAEKAVRKVAADAAE